jgi:hypothetical protein
MRPERDASSPSRSMPTPRLLVVSTWTFRRVSRQLSNDARARRQRAVGTDAPPTLRRSLALADDHCASRNLIGHRNSPSRQKVQRHLTAQSGNLELLDLQSDTTFWSKLLQFAFDRRSNL